MSDATDVPRLEDLPVERGTRVLLRADFNVPLEGGAISDDLRIRAALSTIEALRERGAVVIACSHLGRPKGGPDPALSLRPVAERLGELLGVDVTLSPEVVGDETRRLVQDLAPGDVLLLENLRFDPGETANDDTFATALGDLADVYVDDAFGAAHRSHASVVGPPERLPSAAGCLLAREVEVLGGLLEDPSRPFVGVLGGVKVSDKLGVVGALQRRCDRLLVGGAMAFTFLAAGGAEVGASRVEEDRVDDCRALLEAGGIELPTDVVVAGSIDADAETQVVDATAIPDGWMGLDIGPRTAAAYSEVIRGAATVLWNGPMGVFELEPFAAGTAAVADAVANASAFTVVGGGDSAAAVRALGRADDIDHVSTGGGASLEFVEHGDLPGLAALRSSSR